MKCCIKCPLCDDFYHRQTILDTHPLMTMWYNCFIKFLTIAGNYYFKQTFHGRPLSRIPAVRGPVLLVCIWTALLGSCNAADFFSPPDVTEALPAGVSTAESTGNTDQISN